MLEAQVCVSPSNQRRQSCDKHVARINYHLPTFNLFEFRLQSLNRRRGQSYQENRMSNPIKIKTDGSWGEREEVSVYFLPVI